MSKCACVMMVRNEDLLIEPWLSYHAQLFGLENIVVIDNGSETATMSDVLSRFELQGLTVDRSHHRREDFRRKGEIVSDHLRRLSQKDDYDFLFPLDCDEFIVRFTNGGVACDHDGLRSYLSSLPAFDGTFRSNHQLLNVPGESGLFYCWGGAKTFYKPNSFGWTDRGFHLDGSIKGAGFFETDIAYLHFHNKPFSQLLKSAIAKLELFTDIGSRMTLQKLIEDKAPGCHLAPYLLMTESDYYSSFKSKSILNLSTFVELTKSSGIVSNFLQTGLVGSPEKHTEVPALTMHDQAGHHGTAFDRRTERFIDFDAKAYLEKNPDIAKAAINPVAHFLTWGQKEMRLLS